MQELDGVVNDGILSVYKSLTRMGFIYAMFVIFSEASNRRRDSRSALHPLHCVPSSQQGLNPGWTDLQTEDERIAGCV